MLLKNVKQLVKRCGCSMEFSGEKDGRRGGSRSKVRLEIIERYSAADNSNIINKPPPQHSARHSLLTSLDPKFPAQTTHSRSHLKFHPLIEQIVAFFETTKRLIRQLGCVRRKKKGKRHAVRNISKHYFKPPSRVESSSRPVPKRFLALSLSRHPHFKQFTTRMKVNRFPLSPHSCRQAAWNRKVENPL